MVTAIVVNYYSSEITARSVRSILTEMPDAQVVVVDNSVDSQEEEQLSCLLPPEVELVVNAENRGFGKACNQGFALARYEWIFLLNPDAYVLKDCINKLLQFLITNPRVGAVSPQAFWDNEESWFLPPGQLPTPASVIALNLAFKFHPFGKFISGHFRRHSLNTIRGERAIRQKMLSGGHVLLRKTAINDAGGLFDENLFMFYEDTDLCFRLQERGYLLYLLPNAYAVHEWKASQEKDQLGEESRSYYFKKHFPSGRIVQFVDQLTRSRPSTEVFDFVDIGLCLDPPILKVPAEIENSWIVEFSTHSLFVPALYSFGTGGEARLGEKLWERLCNGNYFVRISSSVSWRKRSCYFKFTIKRTN